MLRPAPIALLALVLGPFACSTGSMPPTGTTGTGGGPSQGGNPGAPGGDGGADAAPSGLPAACAFSSSPVSFALPTITDAVTPAFSGLTGEAACQVGASKLEYTLGDMNDDGQPDLAVTSTCDDTTVGVSTWLVYLNTGSGFATTPIRFAIPTPSPTAGCASVSIFDLNGDGLPDYVVTSLCTDATVGTSRWLVYPNVRTGFASTSSSYVLPPGFSAGAFTTTSTTTPTCTGGKNVPAFSVFDLDGDAIPDFVLTQTCNDSTVGTTQWLEYAGSAAGTSQTSTSFALPTTPVATTGAFDGLTGTLSCSSTVNKPQYGLLDFDGDGKVDLLVTEDCVDAAVGTSSWLFYRNDGEGFASMPSTIALPQIPQAPTGSFTSLYAAGDCATNGAPSYALEGVLGDGRADLLVWNDCHDPLTGVSYWKVYANTGTSFASSSTTLALPAALGAQTGSPLGLAGGARCTAPVLPAFTTAYLAGFAFDIVVTGSCTDTTVGASRWLLFAASCK